MPNDVQDNVPQDNTLDEGKQRLLAHMARGPEGHYTAVQLARNLGVSLPEVQRRLVKLQRTGYIVRSTSTVVPAYQLAAQGRAST
jgi:DNA-binding Lrp family transcriptional regulator